MSLSYEEVQSNLHQIEFSEVDKYAIDDFWGFLKEQEFTKEHKVFYPKGIFTEKGISSYYFFTDRRIVKLSLSSELDISFWKYEQVYNYKLKFLNRYDLQLEIKLKDKVDIILNSEKDTNEHRHVTMKDKIKCIFELLENK